MKDCIDVISLGAGKQSIYMTINAMLLNYKYEPDYVVFSDLGCEPKAVYDYLEWFKDVFKFRFSHMNCNHIDVIKKGNLMSDINDYVSGKVKRVSQIPLYLDNDSMVRRGCTEDYKIFPIRRFIREKMKLHNKEESKTLGAGYYNDITTTVYNCYLDGVLRKQIESNQGLVITYY